MEVLGMKARTPEFLAPLCGTRNMTVVISVNRKLLPALNVALAKLVGQAFRVVLLLRPDVDAAKVRRRACLLCSARRDARRPCGC